MSNAAKRAVMQAACFRLNYECRSGEWRFRWRFTTGGSCDGIVEKASRLNNIPLELE